jgi:hypothetical protein
VPGYEILDELGRGGFGVVYEAIQASVKRRVALKILAAGDTDEAAEHRFRGEARTVGALSWHHHIVSLYDAGMSPDGHLYLVMELLPGGSLAQRIRTHGPLDAVELLTVARQMADALAAAHEAGILHRDVKPANILQDRRGNYVLSDFGVASLNSGTKSTTGSYTGTIAFSAPELLRGHKATERSDLYSLGASLHALATGVTPFSAATDDSYAAILLRILEDRVPELPSTVPVPLAEVIVQLMSKDPDNRPESAAAARDALAALTMERPTADPLSAATAPQPVYVDDSDTVRRSPARADQDYENVKPSAILNAQAGVGDDHPERAGVAEVQGSDAATLVRPHRAAKIASVPGGESQVPRKRRRLVTAVIGVLLVACLVGAVLLLAPSGGEDPARGDADRASAQKVPARSKTTTTHTTPSPPKPSLVGEMDLGTTPMSWTVAGEPAHPMLWAARRPADSTPSLEIIDPSTPDAKQTVALPLDPNSTTNLIWAPGAAWLTGTTASEATLLRLDPASGKVLGQRSLPFSSDEPIELAVTDAEVWTAGTVGGTATLVGVDPRTLDTKTSVPLAVDTLDEVAATTTEVLITSFTGSGSDLSGGLLTRYDTRSRAITTTELAQPLNTLSIGERASWLGSRDAFGQPGGASRIRPSDGTVFPPIEISQPVMAIAADAGGGAWMTTTGLDTSSRDHPADVRSRLVHLDATGVKDGELEFKGAFSTLNLVGDQAWLVVVTYDTVTSHHYSLMLVNIG